MKNNAFCLQRGDKVALIAPASGQKQSDCDLVSKAIDVLAQWGLSVVITPRLQPHRYLSANDNCRAAQLITALTHPEVKAIFVTRGGYGCARLLPYLSECVVPTPRYLVGFSDITTLHLYALQHKNLLSLHAPNLATVQFLAANDMAKTNRQALHNRLFDGITPRWQLIPLDAQRGVNPNRTNVGENTPRIGGCLSLLVSSLGTKYEVQTQGKVLMLEDIGEAPYKIDRMLTQLRHAGKFEPIKALVFGDMTDCNSPQIDLNRVLLDEFSNDNFPVYHCKQFGHGRINLPWLYG